MPQKLSSPAPLPFDLSDVALPAPAAADVCGGFVDDHTVVVSPAALALLLGQEEAP